MRPTQHDDSDWLRADTIPAPPSTPPRAATTGAWRCDDVDAEPMCFGTLVAAIAEPPLTPEARIYGSGTLLAQSCVDTATWRMTDAGRERIERIEREVRGTVAA